MVDLKSIQISAREALTGNLWTTQIVYFDWKGFICADEDNIEQCKDYEIRMCCPIDWDCKWEEYGPCDKECGTGQKTRVSSCLNGNGQPTKTG